MPIGFSDCCGTWSSTSSEVGSPAPLEPGVTLAFGLNGTASQPLIATGSPPDSIVSVRRVYEASCQELTSPSTATLPAHLGGLVRKGRRGAEVSQLPPVGPKKKRQLPRMVSWLESAGTPQKTIVDSM